MIANLKWLMPLVVVGLPLTASAQASDATYCRRLTARYEAFIENMSGHSMQPGGIDGQLAMAQCKAGDTGRRHPRPRAQAAGRQGRLAEAQLVRRRVDRGGRPLAAPINALPRVCNPGAGQLSVRLDRRGRRRPRFSAK